MKGPNAEVLRAMSADKKAPPKDKLDQLREAAIRLRDLEASMRDVTDKLDALREQRSALIEKSLPDLMDQAGVPSIELEAYGNLPAISLKLTPYYRAGISADWPEERRAAAFKYLEDHDAGDLVRTVISVSFPKEHSAQARDAVVKMRQLGLEPEIKQDVHWKTLTSWLQETIEEGHEMPKLDVIGGSVGRVVKVKEV